MGTVERFWSCVDRSGGPRACHPWKGPRNRDGTGVFKARGRRTTARRFAWRLEHGDPGKLRVTPRCRNTGCCNVRHMRVATRRALVLASASPVAANAETKSCRKCGRLLDASNVYVHPGSRRRECATCKRARSRRGVTAGGDVRHARQSSRVG